MFYKQLCFLLILIIVSTLSSCKLGRNAVYLRNSPDTMDVANAQTQTFEYRLAYEDALYINIKTYNEEFNQLFDGRGQILGSNNNQQYFRNADASHFSGYTVNDSGYVNLPVFGFIKVGGLTISEINKLMYEIVNQKVEDAFVEVKLLSYRITFLGEIRSIGTINVYRNKVNIFDAIAIAGDLNPDADKRNIQLLRATPFGTHSVKLDLTDTTILSSSYYYLQPDDMLIVHSRKAKWFKRDVGDYFFIISTFTSALTTSVLILNYIENLKE